MFYVFVSQQDKMACALLKVQKRQSISPAGIVLFLRGVHIPLPGMNASADFISAEFTIVYHGSGVYFDPEMRKYKPTRIAKPYLVNKLLTRWE